MTGAHETDDDGFLTIGEKQAGAVANRQLRSRGMTAEQIKALIRKRVLHRTPARGVYRVAGAERSPRQDLWVALLAGPEGSLASHLSAAALRGLLAEPAVPHVTVPRWANGKFGGAIVHHAQVGAVDRETYEGIEVTGLGRTIVDCAAILGQKGLNSLVDAAFGRGLCSYGRVMDAWERAGRVRGGSLLAAALAPYSAGAEPGSVKAAHVLRRIQDWGLPMPRCEKVIRDTHGGFIARVDFIWEPWWLILEYDGDEFHGPRRWGSTTGSKPRSRPWVTEWSGLIGSISAPHRRASMTVWQVSCSARPPVPGPPGCRRRRRTPPDHQSGHAVGQWLTTTGRGKGPYRPLRTTGRAEGRAGAGAAGGRFWVVGDLSSYRCRETR